MISQREALRIFASQAATNEPELYPYNILTQKNSTFMYGWFDFPAEDILVQCLKNPETPPWIFDAIIAACKKVGAEFSYKLLSPKKDDLQDGQTFPLERLLRLVHLVKLGELQSLLLALMASIIPRARDFPGLARSVLSAFSAYPQKQSDAVFWEEYIEIPDFAAFAFRQLVSINPNSPQIKENLKELWKKQLKQNWEIDAAFLTEELLNKIGITRVMDIFESIKSQDIALFNEIKKTIENRAQFDPRIVPIKEQMEKAYPKALKELFNTSNIVYMLNREPPICIEELNTKLSGISEQLKSVLIEISNIEVYTSSASWQSAILPDGAMKKPTSESPKKYVSEN